MIELLLSACLFPAVPGEGAGPSPVSPGLVSDYPDSLHLNVAVGDGPNGICVLPDGDYVYVTNDYSDDVSVIRTSDHTVVTTVDVGDEPRGVSCSADGQWVFVGNFAGSTLSVIEVSTNQVVHTLPSVPGPWSSCVLGANPSLLYLTCYSSNQVAVVDVSDSPPEILDMITVGQDPRGICCLPGGDRLYVTNWSDSTVSVIDASVWPNEVVATVGVLYFPQAVAASPDGEYVWVGNFGFDSVEDTISIIRTSDNTVVGQVTTGAGPESIAFLSGGDYAYVSNRWDDSVSIIHTAVWPHHEVATVAVGDYPWNLCCHPSGSFVYVACVDSDLVCVIGESGTGIQSPSSPSVPDLVVSPNPGSGVFTLLVTLPEPPDQTECIGLEIFDVTGRLVERSNAVASGLLTSTQVILEAPGFYVCRAFVQGVELRASFVSLP